MENVVIIGRTKQLKSLAKFSINNRPGYGGHTGESTKRTPLQYIVVNSHKDGEGLEFVATNGYAFLYVRDREAGAWQVEWTKDGSMKLGDKIPLLSEPMYLHGGTKSLKEILDQSVPVSQVKSDDRVYIQFSRRPPGDIGLEDNGGERLLCRRTPADPDITDPGYWGAFYKNFVIDAETIKGFHPNVMPSMSIRLLGLLDQPLMPKWYSRGDIVDPKFGMKFYNQRSADDEAVYGTVTYGITACEDLILGIMSMRME